MIDYFLFLYDFLADKLVALIQISCKTNKFSDFHIHVIAVKLQP